MARYILDIATESVTEEDAQKEAQGLLQNIIDALDHHAELTRRPTEVHLVEATNEGQLHNDPTITKNVVEIAKELSIYAEKEAEKRALSFLERFVLNKDTNKT